MRSFDGVGRADIWVWIVAAEAWEPETVFDEPPASRALFPAVARLLARDEARAFVEGFNAEMVAHGGRRWAIARRAAAGAEEALSLPRVALEMEMEMEARPCRVS